MPKPIAPAKGIAFAFPDVCWTPISPTSEVPLPYPNIAKLEDASDKTNISVAEFVVGSDESYVLLGGGTIDTSTGDEAGSGGGVLNGRKVADLCEIVQASQTVLYGPDGQGIVRFMDKTSQNAGNANGHVLSSFPSVIIGD